MSLTPWLLSDFWEEMVNPTKVLNPVLELAALPVVDPHALPSRVIRPCYYRPWADIFRQNERGTSTVQADKDKFQVVLDVQQFEPSEIDVKVVDNCVVVTAKHEEKRDEHGWISRQFVRKYLIPEQCDIEQVASKLSTDGVLTITAPRKEQPKTENNERVIKIEHTGKPALQAKPTKKHSNTSEKTSEKSGEKSVEKTVEKCCKKK